ncbi:HYC_CC_PP family protein [Chitinophaga eiseniae]|uniref:Uncharacterized protein n=1 Tax=Chitinophaga eiseniae TaxID=634771 RepID=A0A847SCM8_9BACT|nr:hypothetical protein [Chitinophaga eiseniae]NLR77934.1 hypothetical protein [Chitinophaga eiseniae]
MKKVFTLLLAILYLGSSTGATFHLHYCMDKLVTVQLWHQDSPCSKCGPSPEKSCTKPCCKDKYKTVKLDKDHKVSENTAQPQYLAAGAVPVVAFEFAQAYVTPLVIAFPITHAPPYNDKVPSHILHCTFRI